MTTTARVALAVLGLAFAGCRSAPLAPRGGASGSSSDAGPADDAGPRRAAPPYAPARGTSYETTDYPRTSWHPVAPGPCGAPPCAPPAPCAVPTSPCAPPCAPPAPCASPCDDPCARMTDSRCLVITARARYWRPWPTGTVFITKGGAPGSATTVDLHDDMDLDPENEWMAGLDVRVGRHRARLAYEPLSFTGTSTLDRPVVYHATTYPQGERTKSRVDLTLYEAGYQYALVDGCSDSVWAGLSGWVWTFDGRMKGETSGLNESRSFTHVYPVATAAAEHRFGEWKIAAGANLGGVATDRFVVDLEASVGIRLFGHVNLEAGWRWMRFDFHETTNKASMTFQGPFLGIGGEF